MPALGLFEIGFNNMLGFSGKSTFYGIFFYCL